MATGDLLYSTGQPSLPARVLIPPEDAATEALAAYLSRALFTIHAGDAPIGDLSRPRQFKLAQVGTEWPDPSKRMAYPSATIFGQDDTQIIGSGTPRAMEGLWNELEGTVPWLLGTATGTLQVDFWNDQAPTRQAIAAQLGGLFSPGENRAGIILRLSPLYLCLAGRFSLISRGRMDTPDQVWAGEHRLRAVVRWEVPEVQLRRAVRFQPRLPAHVETDKL